MDNSKLQFIKKKKNKFRYNVYRFHKVIQFTIIVSTMSTFKTKMLCSNLSTEASHNLTTAIVVCVWISLVLVLVLLIKQKSIFSIILKKFDKFKPRTFDLEDI